MTKIEFREVTSPVKNPAFDSRTKDTAKHGVRPLAEFAAGTRFVHVIQGKGVERVTIVAELREVGSDDKAVIAALMEHSKVTSPKDFREAVMSQSEYRYNDYGEDVVNFLLDHGKIEMGDLLVAIDAVLAAA